ncbi:MAG: bifunctional folylpolyglutamate synthase/dihydrofolate synthase, partial [bacterium]
PTERIQIAGASASAADFAAAFDRVHLVAERLLRDAVIDAHPTYFETVTAMALLMFRDRAVETAVVEVGLGGRLDATNVVQPALCVITPIDFDHEAMLGSTLEAIAREKAGILKPGVPAVFARQRTEAAPVLTGRAAELGVPVTRTASWRVSDLQIDASSSRFSAEGPCLLKVHCPLAGCHQVENSLTAAVALSHFGVAPDGIAEARWPGRLERVRDAPEILLDGAHNPAGARALAAYMRRFYPDRRIWLVYGSMRDKSIEEIADILFPLAAELILTAPAYQRALRPEALLELSAHPRARVAPDVRVAVDLVLREAAPGDAVFFSGSLFLVGEARALLVQ